MTVSVQMIQIMNIILLTLLNHVSTLSYLSNWQYSLNVDVVISSVGLEVFLGHANAIHT